MTMGNHVMKRKNKNSGAVQEEIGHHGDTVGNASQKPSIAQDNPKLLFTLNQPPTIRNGVYREGRATLDEGLNVVYEKFNKVKVLEDPRQVTGLVMLDKYLYVVYEEYNKVHVFACKNRCKKIKNIKVKEMSDPVDLVGSSVTSHLFINDAIGVIWRVDLKTGDVVNKTVTCTSLSLAENRVLVTSFDSLFMFDIVSGEISKKIPFTEDIRKNGVRHAIESNKDSFFVSHGPSDNRTVSEIDSEGRVIRVFDNKQQFDCYHLALDSVGRLLVVDSKNGQVVLIDEHLKYGRILIDNERLDNDNAWPKRLNYNKNKNRLTVGLDNGHVKIFEY